VSGASLEPFPKGAVKTKERAAPLPCLAITCLVGAAIFVATFLALLAMRAVDPLELDITTPLWLAFFTLLGVQMIPLLLMLRAATISRHLWHQQKWVPAREAAARARSLGVHALGLSIIIIMLLLAVIFLTSNKAAVQRTFFDPDIIALSFIQVTRMLGVNIFIAVCSMFLAIVIGLGLAVMRLLPGRGMRALRMIAIAIIDTFRALPAMVVIYLICFGLPLTRIPVLSQQDPILYAIIALTLVYAAYLAELFRSGLEAIHTSQYSAALSLGLSLAAVYRLVIIPQMARQIAPPLLGYFIGLQKDTALVNVVGIVDAFTQAKIYSSNYYNLSSVTVVCILFIILTIPQTRFVDYLIARSDGKKMR